MKLQGAHAGRSLINRKSLEIRCRVLHRSNSNRGSFVHVLKECLILVFLGLRRNVAMNEPLRRFLEFSRWLAIGIFHNVAVALVDVHGAVGNHRIDVFLVNRLVRKGRIVPAAPPRDPSQLRMGFRELGKPLLECLQRFQPIELDRIHRRA